MSPVTLRPPPPKVSAMAPPPPAPTEATSVGSLASKALQAVVSGAGKVVGGQSMFTQRSSRSPSQSARRGPILTDSSSQLRLANQERFRALSAARKAAKPVSVEVGTVEGSQQVHPAGDAFEGGAHRAAALPDSSEESSESSRPAGANPFGGGPGSRNRVASPVARRPKSDQAEPNPRSGGGRWSGRRSQTKVVALTSGPHDPSRMEGAPRGGPDQALGPQWQTRGKKIRITDDLAVTEDPWQRSGKDPWAGRDAQGDGGSSSRWIETQAARHRNVKIATSYASEEERTVVAGDGPSHMHRGMHQRSEP